jgi:hypothetical protein
MIEFDYSAGFVLWIWGKHMAKVAIRRDELNQVLETVRRAAERTNSVVVVAEDRLDVTEGAENHRERPRDQETAALIT